MRREQAKIGVIQNHQKAVCARMQIHRQSQGCATRLEGDKLILSSDAGFCSLVDKQREHITGMSAEADARLSTDARAQAARRGGEARQTTRCAP
jgi:hypothetical protein